MYMYADTSKSTNEGEDPYGGSTDEDSDMDTREAPGEGYQCVLKSTSS